MAPHQHRSEDGLGIHLVFAPSPLVEEDLLWVGLPAQQLQLLWRHFGHACEPLNRRLLLRPRPCGTARDGHRSSGTTATANFNSPSPKSLRTLATYGLSSSSPSMRMCWPVEMTVVLGRPSTRMAKDLQPRRAGRSHPGEKIKDL